jgi:hypothetical protein
MEPEPPEPHSNYNFIENSQTKKLNFRKIVFQ